MTIQRSRRTLAVLAISALMLTACNGDSSDDPTDAGSSSGSGDRTSGGGEGQVLEVWTRSNPDPARTYDAVFEAFTEATGIEVNHQAVVEFDQQLQSRASSGDVPDVLINNAASMGSYASQGIIVPLDPAALGNAGQVTDESWAETVGLDGDTYGVPFSRQAMFTFIRQDWRESLGYDVPTTWDELIELADAFATQDPDGNGADDTYGINVPGSVENGYLGWWASSYIWQGGGDIVVDNGDGSFSVEIDSLESQQAVEWLKESFCSPGRVVPGALTLTTSTAQYFVEGSAGIYLTGPYNMDHYDDMLGEDYEVIPTPVGPGGAWTLAEGENVYIGAGATESDEKFDAALQLADFLISVEGQTGAMSLEYSAPVVRIPVNTEVDILEVHDGDERWALNQEIYQNSARAFPANISFQPIRLDLSEGLNAIFASCDADNVASGLADLAETLRAELESQGVTTR